MYRIELAPGEVTVFRTIEELAVGVRNGVITPRARIYHAASEKWLPIEFHPHYKKVVETPAGRPVVIPPSKPADRPRGEGAALGAAPLVQPAASPFAHAPAAHPLVHAPAASPIVQGEETSPIALELPPEPGDAGDEAEDSTGAESYGARYGEAPRTESAGAAGAPVPHATVSPVLQLPRIIYPEISYPEISPAEEPSRDHAPRGERSRRPLHLAGVAVLLAVGGYLVTSAFSPAHAGDEPATAPVVTDRPALPQAEAPAQPSSDHPAAAPSTPAPPASSGFAAALEARANVPAPAMATTPEPSIVPGPDAGLADVPAPIEMDLAAPEVPTADSLAAASRQRDSAAIKRILRAVSGKEPTPQP
jgi:hypothetical protein